MLHAALRGTHFSPMNLTREPVHCCCPSLPALALQPPSNDDLKTTYKQQELCSTPYYRIFLWEPLMKSTTVNALCRECTAGTYLDENFRCCSGISSLYLAKSSLRIIVVIPVLQELTVCIRTEHDPGKVQLLKTDY